MNITERIQLAKDKVTSLPKKDRNSINELLEHNEWGVALETLCAAIFEEKIPISLETYVLIRDAGNEMEMDPNNWEKIKPS